MAGETKHITQAIKHLKAAEREVRLHGETKEFNLAYYECKEQITKALSWAEEIRDNVKEDNRR